MRLQADGLSALSLYVGSDAERGHKMVCFSTPVSPTIPKLRFPPRNDAEKPVDSRGIRLCTTWEVRFATRRVELQRCALAMAKSPVLRHGLQGRHQTVGSASCPLRLDSGGGGIELGRPWPLPRRRDRCGDRTKFPVSRAPVARALRSVLAPRLAQDADRSTVRCRRAARSMRLRVDPSPAGRFELGSVELERWRRRSPKRLRGPARCPAD